MKSQEREDESKNSVLGKITVPIASAVLILLVVVCSIRDFGFSVPIERLLYLILPLVVVSVGHHVSLGTEKYGRYVSIFGKFFLAPFVILGIYLFLFYFLAGSVKGAFSRVPIEIATQDPFSALNAILHRFLWDIGYSGLAALVVASVTPFFVAVFVRFHDRVYMPVLKILGGDEEPNNTKNHRTYSLFQKIKAFTLLNAIFSTGVILFLPKFTGTIYTEVISPYGSFLSPDPMLLMSIAPLLSSILIEIREGSHKMYWTYLKLLVSVISISNAVSFVVSPLARNDFVNLLQIIPGILLYNVVGVSIFTLTLKEELLERLSQKARISIAFVLITGFVIFVAAGWAWRELLWDLPNLVAYMLSVLLDSIGVAVTVLASCLILERTTPVNSFHKTLLLQSFVWIMLIEWIWVLRPIETQYAVIWPGVLFLNIVAGLLFFFLRRISFTILGLSLVLATWFYGGFGWGQIATTIGSMLLSLWLRQTFFLMCPHNYNSKKEKSFPQKHNALALKGFTPLLAFGSHLFPNREEYGAP